MSFDAGQSRPMIAVCALRSPSAPGGLPCTAQNSQRFSDLIIFKGILKSPLYARRSIKIIGTGQQALMSHIKRRFDAAGCHGYNLPRLTAASSAGRLCQ